MLGLPVQLGMTDEQEAFREAVRRFIQTEVPLTKVRDLYESPEGHERAWWQQAARLGWTSLFVDERYGGGSLSGGQVRDAVILAEEIGRGLAPGPFLPVNVVAAGVSEHGSEALKEQLLPALVSGEAIAVWAFAERAGRWTVDGSESALEDTGDGLLLTGAKHYVEAAGSATHALVTARWRGLPTQVIVDLDGTGVSVRRGRSIDMVRRFGVIGFENALVEPDHVVGGLGEAAEAIQRQVQIAVALQCAELVGIADRTLAFTLASGRDRVACGRSIWSFQALTHRIADMAQWLEASKALAGALAEAVDESDPDAMRLLHVAKAYVGDKATRIVDDCVQITGGIGVTWEHDIHMYNRRAALLRALYGSPEEHKEGLYRLLEATVGAGR